MKSLSAGNVVSVGLRIYRDNFKQYYSLAFIAALWSWIPIYGTAKFLAAMGLISRLAFGEITDNPETITEARRHLKPKMWSFLGAALLVGLRLLLGYLLAAVAMVLLFAVIGLLSRVLGGVGAITSIISAVLGVVGLIAFVIYIVRLIALFLIFDLPLAVEENISASQSVKRSIELTKGSVWNIQLVVFIASLITIPLWSVAIAIQVFPEFLKNSDSPVPFAVVYILSLVVSSATSAFITPLWQTIKTAVYYDLRVRREGLGMQLRDKI